jgi:polar amino acid transport system substrate-binding protein
MGKDSWRLGPLFLLAFTLGAGPAKAVAKPQTADSAAVQIPASSAQPVVSGGLGTDAHPLVVGTHRVAPFIVPNPDGSFSGISIDVWRHIADGMGIKYVIREIDFSEVDKPKTNGIDVYVSRNISHVAEENYDMSHAFYTTGLAIATRQVSGSVWSDLAASVFTRSFLKGVGILALVIFAMGTIVWFAERQKNKDDFGGHPVKGILGGVFWTIESLFGKSKALTRTAATRVITLLWVFATTLLISGVTAKLSAEFTANKLKAAVNGPADLPKVRVGAIKTASVPSTAADYLERRGIAFEAFEDNEQQVDALASGEVEAVVGEAPLLRYNAEKRHPGKLVVLPGTFRNHGYGFAFQHGSPLFKDFNKALLKFVTTEDYKAIITRYIGSSE